MKTRSVVVTTMVGMVMLLVSACASPAPPFDAAAVQVTVRVGLYGGPVKPDGTRSDVNAPAEGTRVTLTGPDDATTTQTTDTDGTAVFHVQSGSWTINTACANPQKVNVAGSPVVVTVRCIIP